MKILTILSMFMALNVHATVVEYIGNNEGSACHVSIDLSNRFVQVDEYSVKAMTSNRIEDTLRMLGMSGPKTVIITLELNKSNEFVSAKYESLNSAKVFVTDAFCTDLVKIK